MQNTHSRCAYTIPTSGFCSRTSPTRYLSTLISLLGAVDGNCHACDGRFNPCTSAGDYGDWYQRFYFDERPSGKDRRDGFVWVGVGNEGEEGAKEQKVPKFNSDQPITHRHNLIITRYPEAQHPHTHHPVSQYRNSHHPTSLLSPPTQLARFLSPHLSKFPGSAPMNRHCQL